MALGREGWKKVVAEFESSGLSHKEFATQKGVALSTMQFWIYKFRKESRLESSGSFLPVTVVASAAPKARPGEVVEAALRSGIIVRFGAGTDTRYLAELFAALG